MFGRKKQLADLRARLARLEAAVAAQALMPPEMQAMGKALAGQAEWLANIQSGLTDLATGHGAQLRDMERWLSSTTQTVTALSSMPVIASPALQALGPRPQLVDDRVAAARMLKIWTVMSWLPLAPVESEMLISVVVPTRNRRPFLERAVGTILGQRHKNIDLVIVNDGSSDDTADYLASITDPRVRCFATTGLGASAARNLGLEHARGAVVTHFDDDNLMHPEWLRGVAWGFTRWPETELLYGARIIEDGPARDGVPSGHMPVLEWHAFDREKLEQTNYIDMNVIAHRAGLAGAWFDPKVRACIEWEMLLRLTAKSKLLELPVLACLYSNYSPNRLSNSADFLTENRLVRARVHTTRPMRVLSYNAMFPLLSETYIEEEMLALEGQGAQIAFAAFQESASPYPISQKIYGGLEEGIAAQNPDVVMVYWTTHALGELDHLARTGRPFALRVHSFDYDPAQVARVREHPGCIGVWAYPHHAANLPGAHALVPIFSTQPAMPAPAAERGVVASISAGLPKKDWPLLFDALARVDEFEQVVVLARSNGFEHVPDEVMALAAARTRPPAVHVNLPRQEVFALLARTSVLIYTVTPDVATGMPMSIIEALAAGACVITPDRPELRDLCGAGFRPYHDAAGIAAHVREIMAGGPTIDAEREDNRRQALARFCDPALGKNFHAELSAALTAWRRRRQEG